VVRVRMNESERANYLDLFVGPVNEKLVVVGGLFREAGREVDGHCQVHSLPVGFQQYAKLLRSSQSKHWDEHLCDHGQLLSCTNGHESASPTITQHPVCGGEQTFPPFSTQECTLLRKSRSRHRFESRMVVAYVDSVISTWSIVHE
jgi:hypothetical protein